MKIAVFYIGNICNAGDEILGRVTARLIEEREGCEAALFEFLPNNEEMRKVCGHKPCILARAAAKALNVAAARLPAINARWQLESASFKARRASYYRRIARAHDAIVTAVGSLKFSTQSSSYAFDALAIAAQKEGCPVMISGANVQAFNAKDWRARQLRRAVNRGSVKMITTRDGEAGVASLRGDYIEGGRVAVDFAADTAFWLKKSYEIPESCGGEGLIGINLIRGRIYEDYGTSFSAESLLNFYVDLMQTLERHGKRWRLFCNGMQSDWDFGAAALERARLPKDRLLPRPKDAQSYIFMVKGFDAVFAARLHACIVAFVLDIPLVGLLWDGKLRAFARTMKIEHLFCETAELTGESVASRLEEAARTKYDGANRDFYKERTLKNMNQFIDDFAAHSGGKPAERAATTGGGY